MKHQIITFRSFLLLFLFAGIVLTGCKKEETPIQQEEEEVDACAEANENNEWGYDDFGGPECWNSVCSHGECTGNAQSPIDIVGADTSTTMPTLLTNPSITTTSIVNNGATLQFNVQPGSFMSYGTVTGGFINDLTLGQFHFHTSAEHKVNGTQAAMEAHLVHRSIWENKYIVLSVMFEEGAENAFLKQFEDVLPTAENTNYQQDTLTYNPYDILPADRSYYHYTGSLTTPPCSEIVTWIVFENKVTATAAQIQKFSDILNNNFRPTQEINGRTISYVVN